MRTNCTLEHIAAIEITNELPVNRLGGVGSVIDNLISGFRALDVPVLWYLLDHHYREAETEHILATFPNVAIGSVEELAELDAPIAHLHTYNHDPRLLDALTGKRTIFTIHSLLRCEDESNNIDLAEAIAHQERLIRGCDAIALLSEAERVQYDALGYGALNERVHVVHNGLRDPGRCYQNVGSRTLGFCGRLVPRKRPEFVQWILREPGFEKHTALIAGRGFSHYARELMSDPALDERVHYLGWCGGSRLEAFYGAIELLVIPSAYEPFGMVALEAMARGIPVLCRRVGGLVEVLGDEAVFMEEDSYEAFQEAMTAWLCTDGRALQERADRARRRYQERFTDVMMAERYRSLFAADGTA